MELNTTCTQAEFGDLVGVTQPAVSDMLGRGVLTQGHTTGQWLHAYCTHLRGVAAGRGSDSELAYERAELTRVNRERAQIKLAVESKEFAPIAVIEQVLSHIGRSVAGYLEPLPGQIHKLCPALTPEDVARIQSEVSKACDVAAGASLALLSVDEQDAQSGAETERDDVQDDITGNDGEIEDLLDDEGVVE